VRCEVIHTMNRFDGVFLICAAPEAFFYLAQCGIDDCSKLHFLITRIECNL